MPLHVRARALLRPTCNDGPQMAGREQEKAAIQSFLLGVPRIIVGFRDRMGTLLRLEDIDVTNIPDMVARKGRSWDGNMCINFTSEFLNCECPLIGAGAGQ